MKHVIYANIYCCMEAGWFQVKLEPSEAGGLTARLCGTDTTEDLAWLFSRS
jgi:hypothetical protein